MTYFNTYKTKHIAGTLVLVTLMSLSLSAQKLVSRDNVITFYSHAPLEDITAVNNQVSSVIDFEQKKIAVKMLMKHFHFENALMQEHFNENYIESEKFPTSTFSGSFTSEHDVDPNVNGSYTLVAEGEIELHGVSKPVIAEITMNVADHEIIGTTEFILKPKDFDIEIPSLVVKNIAEDIEVKVDVLFTK